MHREDFIARVREAARQGRAYRVATDDIPPRAGYVGGGEDPIARFAEEVNAVGGAAFIAGDAESARAELARLLEEHRPQSCLCWEHPLLEKLQVASLLTSLGIAPLFYGALAALGEDERREKMLSAEFGVTACDFAVAETGTVAVRSKRGQERAASLLPPVHVALVDAAVILPDLFDLFERLDAEGDLPSNVALITGPSKTGDIELQLTTGVHGPGEWHVIVMRNAA